MYCPERQRDVRVVDECLSDGHRIEERAVGSAQVLDDRTSAFDEEPTVGTAHGPVPYVDVIVASRTQRDTLLLELFQVVTRLVRPGERDATY